MERDRNAFVDAALEFGAVGNQRLEGFGTESVTDLGEVGQLKRSRLLEFRHDVAE